MGLSNNRSNIVEPPKGKGDRKEFDYGEERKSAYVVQKTTKCEIDRGKRTQDHITDKTTKEQLCDRPHNLSSVKWLVTRASTPPGFRVSSDLAKKKSCSDSFCPV